MTLFEQWKERELAKLAERHDRERRELLSRLNCFAKTGSCDGILSCLNCALEPYDCTHMSTKAKKELLQQEAE